MTALRYACIAAAALAAFLLAMCSARAHDMYSAWKRPDTGTSCCSEHDCYPTRAAFRNGRWEAMRREDGKWLVIPHELVIQPAPSDTRAHLCAAAPSFGADKVYCFKPPEAGL